MSKKIPNNCYIDHKGYLMPKCAVIKNSKEVLDWLSENQTKVEPFKGASFYTTTDPYITVNFSHSASGFIYSSANSETEEFYKKFTEKSDFVKHFDNNIEQFKKYVTWVTTKLGPKFTKKFKKE